METQRNEFLKLVDKNDWKATELDNYDFHKWSAESWLLESVWSPIGVKAYVYFELDPHYHSQESFPRAILISDNKPQDSAGQRKTVATTHSDVTVIPTKRFFHSSARAVSPSVCVDRPSACPNVPDIRQRVPANHQRVSFAYQFVCCVCQFAEIYISTRQNKKHKRLISV